MPAMRCGHKSVVLLHLGRACRNRQCRIRGQLSGRGVHGDRRQVWLSAVDHALVVQAHPIRIPDLRFEHDRLVRHIVHHARAQSRESVGKPIRCAPPPVREVIALRMRERVGPQRVNEFSSDRQVELAHHLDLPERVAVGQGEGRCGVCARQAAHPGCCWQILRDRNRTCGRLAVHGQVRAPARRRQFLGSEQEGMTDAVSAHRRNDRHVEACRRRIRIQGERHRHAADRQTVEPGQDDERLTKVARRERGKLILGRVDEIVVAPQMHRDGVRDVDRVTIVVGVRDLGTIGDLDHGKLELHDDP